MNVVDSSGWIEFFLAGPNGPWFRPVIQNTTELLVPVVALYEVHKRLSRALPAEQVQQCLDLMRRGRVLEITDARAIAASAVSQQHQLAMADAIMYACALEFGGTLWTQDVDYAQLPSVRFQAKAV